MTMVGMPQEMVEGMRHTPRWSELNRARRSIRAGTGIVSAGLVPLWVARFTARVVPLTLIHPSAWKVTSRNFPLTGFSEVQASSNRSRSARG
jgi:hypothetical protein